MKNIIHLFSVVLLAVLLASCKPSVPSHIIQPDDMEDILYDYHIAIEAGKLSGKDALTPKIYATAVLKKHKVTQAEFDSSMVYYTRHAESLHTIYESLSERLNREALALGTSASELNRYGALSSTGDTANVWNGDKSLMLMLGTPYVSYSFVNPADTTYHSGDTFILDFDAKFVFQDGIRDMVVVLAVKFANDSVASSMLHCSQTNHFSLTVSDASRKGIKELKGFFMLNPSRGSESSQTTMKLVIVNNIHLVRLHNHQFQANPLPPSKTQEDSIRSSNVSHDSMKVRPHSSSEGLRAPMPTPLPPEKGGLLPRANMDLKPHESNKQ